MPLLIRYWKPIAALILLIAYSWWLYDTGHDRATEAAEGRMAQHLAADAEAAQKAAQAAREAEQRHAADLAAIAQQHEQDKRNAEAAYERDVADLRAGNLRLQNRWRGCEATGAVSEAGRSAAESDAAAADREESAARIVRAAREADDWIRRLQDVIRSDRAANSGE